MDPTYSNTTQGLIIKYLHTCMLAFCVYRILRWPAVLHLPEYAKSRTEVSHNAVCSSWPPLLVINHYRYIYFVKIFDTCFFYFLSYLTHAHAHTPDTFSNNHRVIPTPLPPKATLNNSTLDVSWTPWAITWDPTQHFTLIGQFSVEQTIALVNKAILRVSPHCIPNRRREKKLHSFHSEQIL